MNIGSATQSNSVTPPVRQPERPAADLESTRSEREPDNDRDDKAATNQTAPAKPPKAAVGKGLGLLVDVSF